MDMVFNLMWLSLGACLGVLVMALCAITDTVRRRQKTLGG